MIDNFEAHTWLRESDVTAKAKVEKRIYRNEIA